MTNIFCFSVFCFRVFVFSVFSVARGPRLAQLEEARQVVHEHALHLVVCTTPHNHNRVRTTPRGGFGFDLHLRIAGRIPGGYPEDTRIRQEAVFKPRAWYIFAKPGGVRQAAATGKAGARESNVESTAAVPIAREQNV